MADRLQEVDHDPFVGPVHLVEVDHDPFASQDPFNVRLAQPSGGPQATSARLNEGLDTARSTVADFLTPESFKPQVSAETQADYDRRMSDYMRRDYVGKMDLPNVEPSAGVAAMRGAVDASMLLGSPIEAGGLKLAAAAVPLLRRGLVRGAEVTAPAIARGAERFVTPEGFAIPSRDYLKRAREIVEQLQAGTKGAGPIDLAARGPTSAVPQVALERYDPARGVSPRVKAALVNPDVARGVDESIQTGIGMGAEKWYHTGALRQAWIDELGEKKGNQAFDEYMANVGGSSPRSNAVTNARNASYYYLQGGRDLPEDLPYPYGHVAQNLHRQNYETIYGPGWDLMRNPKPPSFIANLQGNLVPVTADTHAFRNIGMRTGDPRFLEPSLRDLLKNSDPGEAALAARFGEISKGPKGPVVTYRPRQLYDRGVLTLDEAQRIPRFWASQPNPNEYAAVEQFYADRARRAGLQPAEGQSAAWSGAGELTGLDTPPTHTFPEILNERTQFTSMMRGEKPERTLRDLIRRKKPLLGIAGGALVAPNVADFLDQPR